MAGVQHYEWRGSHEFIPQNPQATGVHFKTIDGPLPYFSYVRVKATNVCGSSFEYSKYLWVDDCGGGIPPSPVVVLTPNPTTGETTLTIEAN